jgi:CheY-like chemotaxis protein
MFAVANTRDVTEVVAAQQQLESTQQQLAEATKMDAVGRLAGGVAHDFNNLLTVIAGYAELVSATLDTTDFRAEDLGEIKRAAHRASLLTRQLLAFSRKQVLRPEVLEMNSVVRDVTLPIRRLIGDDIELVIELASTPLPVRTDRSQIEQVLMNLAVNARDAMPVGGRLIIRTAGSGSTVFVIVTDNGTGIPPEVAKRVFEPFFTTKDVGRGAGLGLSTAYGIVRQSNGDIQVQSEMGKGTVFTISLPLARENGIAPPPSTEEIRGGSESILVAEGSEHERELIEQVLLRHGYDVLTAENSTGAIDICRRHRQRIAMLITDVVLAQESGPQLYARVAALVPGIAVLFISGYTGETVLARGAREEGVASLQKPFTPRALAMRVREVLDDANREARAG